MRCRILVVASVYFLIAAPSLAPAADAPVGIEAIARIDELPLLRDGVCRQFSSYDRTGGNDDSGHYLAEKDGVFTLADIHGPGCIYRIWSANPSGTFRLYVNAESRPRIECPFVDLFQARVPPFAPPLAGTSSGGWYSLLPIPFAHSCRIEVAGGERFYYQVTYHQFLATKEVPTFDPKLPPDTLVLIDKAQKLQRRLGEPPYDPDPSARTETKQGAIKPGESVVLADLSGPAEVRSLRLAIEPRHRDVLRGTAIRIYWDDEKDPSVEVPIADFFGCGFGDRRFKALPIGMTDDGYYCYFPMPFTRSARIELANESPIATSFRAEIEHRPLAAPPRASGRFHARWHRARTEAGKPHVILEAKGRGHYVGCTMAMQGTSGIHFLEGDEQVYVDGEKEPSIIGTGAEDFFTSGWYFSTGEFALGFHGLPLKDEPVSRIAAYRFQFGDCVPFRKSIRFQIEHGGVNDYPGADYASVAYWYQEEPHDPWSPLPPYEGRRLRAPRVLGAVEAEAEQPLGSPSPSEEGDSSLPFEASGGRFLRIKPAKTDAPGMAFPVNETGVYEVLAGVVPLGETGGRYSVTVDDRPQPAVLDLGAVPQNRRSEFSVGFVKLERGRHSLRFAADSGGAFGLDYVRLMPPFREDGVVEAESQKAVASPDGRRVEIDSGTLRWSGGSQLRLHGEAAGDAVVLDLPIAEAAIYDVDACLTRGPSYGRFHATLDRGKPGDPVDAYADKLERGPFVALVRGAALDPGTHRLRLEIDGKAESATGLEVGIDCLRLKKALDAGALEAERLKILEAQGGPAIEQGLAGFGPGWSGDSQLFFTPRAAGAFVTLEVPVPENGNFEIAVRFTRAGDYGRVQASLDGQPLGKVFDGFNRGVVPSGRVVLSTEYLRKGNHALRFTVVGKNDESAGFYAGIDSIIFTKKY